MARCLDGTIHGMEFRDLNERFIVAYLWHFERIDYEKEEERKNLRIFAGFRERMLQYRAEKDKAK